MISVKLGENLIQDLFKHAQNEVLTSREYGLLKKGCKEQLIAEMGKLDINYIINIETRADYDIWFDETAKEFHTRIYPLFRDNLNVDINNPYSYSGRLITQYVKYLTFYSPTFFDDAETYLRIQHPIISSAFIKAFPVIEISRISEIKSKEDYYEIVNYYRELLDRDVVDEESSAIFGLKLGIEI